MEITETIILVVVAMIFILLCLLIFPMKKTKSLHLSFGFFKGFDLTTEFYEEKSNNE